MEAPYNGEIRAGLQVGLRVGRRGPRRPNWRNRVNLRCWSPKGLGDLPCASDGSLTTAARST